MEIKKIKGGIRTVLHLIEHMDELKKRALRYNVDFKLNERGYLTPKEDEKMEHLTVSYWQSRAALLDVALNANEEIGQKELSEDEKLSLFIVGYAATIVLVDMARFFSENFENGNPLRKKLNEPNEKFGMPTGIYDAIQKSFNDPKRIWHIYYANQTYEENKKNLERISKKNERLKALLKIIKKLKKRTEIGEWKFIKERLGEFRSQTIGFLKKPIKKQIYTTQESVSRLISFIRLRPWLQPKIPKKVTEEIMKLLQPGDVMITRKEHVMTNYFLPGYWPHAILYLGRVGELEKMGIKDSKRIKEKWLKIKTMPAPNSLRVLESLKDGVHIRSMESPFTNDAMTIIRPKLEWKDIKKAIARGLIHEGKPYDFDFDFRESSRLVCTEVIYRTYEGIGDIHFKLGERAGRLNLAAEDFLKMALKRDQFEPIAIYCPAKSKKIQTGEKMDEIIRKSIET